MNSKNKLRNKIENEIVTVDFHGSELLAIEKDGKQFVAMKPIVEVLGLDWSNQLSNIKNDSSLAPTMQTIYMVAEDGKNRGMVCLPLNMMHGWLLTVNPNLYKNDSRGALIKRYRDECFKVLSAHFMPKQPTHSDSPTVTSFRLLLKEYDAEMESRIGWEKRALAE